jgi:hypothetical protein
MRGFFEKSGKAPTVYETCESNKIETDELERLIPEGYHRCAVKIAGLRAQDYAFRRSGHFLLACDLIGPCQGR